jgi:two-component system, cell cycle sensor histidine kinase and response regulator CckA
MKAATENPDSLAASHRRYTFWLVSGIISLNLLVLALMVTFLLKSRDQYEERVRIQTGNLSLSLSQTVAGCIEKCNVALFSVKAEAQRQMSGGGIDTKSLNAYLAAQRLNIPELMALRIIDAQGFPRAGEGSTPGPRRNLADREYFIAARKNPDSGLIISRPLESRITKAWVINLVLPLENPDGSFAGIAQGAIPLDYFSTLFSSLKIGGNGVLTLRYRDLSVMVRYPERPGQTSRGSKIVSGQLQALLRGGEQTGTYLNQGSIDPIERIFSFHVIAPYPLVVTAGLAKKDYLKPWYREVSQMAVFMALFTSASLLTGWRSYRNRLSQEGNEAELIRYRDHLEDSVRERTAALRDSEEQFRTLCSSAPIGIFRADMQGDVIYLNPHWTELTGLSMAQGLGQGWQSCIHPDDRKLLDETWASTLESGGNFSLEHRQVTPEGKPIWVHTMATPIRDAVGTSQGFVGTVEDITERHQARQELLKNQKLESLGIFAGGIAHDFNNILTAMAGNISLASLQLDRPELARQRLEDAGKAAVRAGDLTKQLLTFAKGGEPVKEMVALPALLRDAAQFALHGTRALVEFNIAGDLSCVEADPGQLIQVIHNLVLNAVQAMPQGGTITLSAANIDLDQGKAITISIADTGTGIPAPYLPKIFDPYFTTKQRGSGLGLATCHSIVTRHGGSLVVSATSEKGSVFTITLPATTRVEIARLEAETRHMTGTGDILLMDDEEDVRGVAKAILEEFGYRVVCTENGAEALVRFQQHLAGGKRYRAVILDLTVPGGQGGKEIVGQLRSLDPAVPVIVSSGYSNDPIMANHRDYGFQAVLSKPYQVENVAAALAACLSPGVP